MNNFYEGNKKYYLLIGGIIIALIVILSAYIVVNRGLTTSRTDAVIPPTLTPTPTPKIYGASVQLKTEDGLLRQSAQNTLVVFVSVDSKGSEVVGYDLTFTYPQKNLKFVRAESQVTDFTIFPYAKDDMISLTGSKSLSSSKPIVFSGANIIKLTFQPLDGGNVTIELVDEYRKTKSQIVDPKSKSKFITPTSITVELY